jgi:hypothetical protein
VIREKASVLPGLFLWREWSDEIADFADIFCRIKEIHSVLTKNWNEIDRIDTRNAILAADIFNWPSKTQLKHILEADGYEVTEWMCSQSLGEMGYFVFRAMEDDSNSGVISAEHATINEFVAFTPRVSRTLTKANIEHRFDLYSDKGELIAYLHHDWPQN